MCGQDIGPPNDLGYRFGRVIFFKPEDGAPQGAKAKSPIEKNPLMSTAFGITKGVGPKTNTCHSTPVSVVSYLTVPGVRHIEGLLPANWWRALRGDANRGTTPATEAKGGGGRHGEKQ
jgi:hypothetical protein